MIAGVFLHTIGITPRGEPARRRCRLADGTAAKLQMHGRKRRRFDTRRTDRPWRYSRAFAMVYTRKTMDQRNSSGAVPNPGADISRAGTRALVSIAISRSRLEHDHRPG